MADIKDRFCQWALPSAQQREHTVYSCIVGAFYSAVEVGGLCWSFPGNECTRRTLLPRSMTSICINLAINLILWEDVSIRDPIYHKLILRLCDLYPQLCACVCMCPPYWQTCILRIFFDHFRATATIDLGMARKCVMFGCVLVNALRAEEKNVHSGEQRWLDWSRFQIICCCEHSTAETGIFSHTAVDECIVSDGC